MGNEKMTKIRDYIVKNSKFVFPVILIVAVGSHSIPCAEYGK